jgi:hypothetical protein
LIEIGSCIADCRESMADPKGSKPSAAVDGASVHPKNTINVTMGDLAEEDRKDVERQLEEEIAEPRRRKLASVSRKHATGSLRRSARWLHQHLR